MYVDSNIMVANSMGMTHHPTRGMLWWPPLRKVGWPRILWITVFPWYDGILPWIPPMQVVNQIAENNNMYSSHAFKKHWCKISVWWLHRTLDKPFMLPDGLNESFVKAQMHCKTKMMVYLSPNKVCQIIQTKEIQPQKERTKDPNGRQPLVDQQSCYQKSRLCNKIELVNIHEVVGEGTHP